MRYTDEIIEEVREKNDIVDVISQVVKLQRRGSNYFGLCPFHNEKSPSFSVNREKQMFYCFGCGKGGNVFTFLMEYENFTFLEAIKYLADRAGVKLPEAEFSKEERLAQDRRARLLEVQKKAALYFVQRLRLPEGEAARRYLAGRGLSDETVRRFGLGYAGKGGSALYRYLKQQGYPDELLKDAGLFHFDEQKGFSDKFWNRVMYPIMDANSRVIGFGGRVMGDGKPKYLNSPETMIFDKSRNLYGLFAARRTKRRNFIICEGYMDVISMHQAGYTNAVASLGTALTVPQCQLIARFTKEVLVIYDMDGAGVHAALRAIPMLREAGLTAKVVNLRPHKDPDEFIKAEGAEAFAARLQEAENSFLFTVRMRARDFDMQDPDGRAAFFRACAAELVAVEDELERSSYMQSIAAQYHVEEELLKNEVGRQALKSVGRAPIQPPRQLSGRAMEQRGMNTADKAQKLMLTWLTDDPQLVKKTAGYLSPEDFTNTLYREVADMVWNQVKASGAVSPASIINHFVEAEKQSEVASLFNTNIALDSDADRKKAFFDVFCRMKRQSIDQRRQALAPDDLSGMMLIMAERQKLEQLRAAGRLPE